MRNVRIDNEAGAQETLFNWAQYQYARYPELELLYHIPNGGYHGLYIELKVGSNKPTPLQKKWLSNLNKQGYLAVVCYGWQGAAEQLINYLELKMAAGGLKSADNETAQSGLMPAT